jgi:hypothetical protein
MENEKEDIKVGAAEEVKATTEGGSSSDSARSEHAVVEKVQDGIVLIPHPSDDPRDPLVRPTRQHMLRRESLGFTLN